jgi:hypothetical protein
MLHQMNGTLDSAWSNLGMLLAERNVSVLALYKRLEKNGVSVNLKSLYRLAASLPLQKIDVRIVKGVCLVLGIDLSELIQLDKPKLSLSKLDPAAQTRIASLLDKGNRGTITKREKAELERLIEEAQKISLHNARVLLEYRRHRAEPKGMTSKCQSRKKIKVSVELLPKKRRSRTLTREYAALFAKQGSGDVLEDLGAVRGERL